MSETVTQSPPPPVATIPNAIEAYRKAGQPFDVPHIQISTWILNNGLFDVSFESKLKQCDKLVAQTLQKQHITTPSGRSARAWAARRDAWVDPETGKERQAWLWNDARTCSAFHLHRSAKEMQEGVKNDWKALRETIDGWNEINPNLRDNPIQLSMEFVTVGGDVDPKRAR